MGNKSIRGHTLTRNVRALVTAATLALVVIGLIIVLVGPENAWEKITKAEPTLLALAFGIEILDLIVVSARWHVFLKAVSNVNFKTTFLITICGQAINNITPGGRVGGEPVKAFLLKKMQDVRFGVSFATIVMERIVDLVAFLVLTLAALAYSFFYIPMPIHITVLMFVAFLFTSSILIGLWYINIKKRIRSRTVKAWLERHEWLARKIPILRHYKEKMEDSLLNYYSHIGQIVSKENVLSIGFALSLAYWLVEISRAYVLFLAFGEQAFFPVIALVYIVSAIIGTLPAGIGGIGLTEGTMIILYSTSNLNTVIASLVTIVDRLLSYWLPIVIGLPLTGYLGIEVMEEGENVRVYDSTSKGSKKG